MSSAALQPESAMAASQAPVAQETTNATGYVRLYANNANITASPYDFVISFGQVTGMKDATTMSVEKMADVIMSPQHAKALAQLLAANIQAYENQVGAIPIPKTDAQTAAK